MKDIYDLIVIGAGPGGYEAAAKAGKLGLKTVLVEKGELGGVCLNWGCIPSKNLIHQAEQFRLLPEMESLGVAVDRSGFNYALAQQNSREVVRTLTNGVSGLLKRSNVETVFGTARISGRGEVTVDGDKKLKGKNILVATGSRPLSVPGFECDEETVLSSNGILALKSLPKSLVILGAGAIGCEFAFVMNSFGVKVTLVEAAPHILPSEDAEVCSVLAQSLKKQGVEVLENTRAESLERPGKGVKVRLKVGDANRELVAEKALVVFGRTPNTSGLGLQEMGVKLDQRGFVQVTEYQQTHATGIYAIGDITSTPALAHVASKEGEIAVNYIAGAHTVNAVQAQDVPSAIYCEPQVAGFGLREDQAKVENIAVKKSVFPYLGAGKSVAVGKSEGLVKVLSDSETGEILGAHIVGYNATELIHELLVAKTTELLPEDIAATIHAHPTLSEVVMEAARGLQ